jgi:hypothetical protein
MFIPSIGQGDSLWPKLHGDALMLRHDPPDHRELTRPPRLEKLLLREREEQLKILPKEEPHLEELILIASELFDFERERDRRGVNAKAHVACFTQ